MPVFTIIAGPNGAGKSTFSAMLSRRGSHIFDPDSERLKIEKQYPDISDDALESALTHKYTNAQARAIASSNHLTVESNLRNVFLLESASLFKKIGYETRLIYILLPDIEASKDRVNLRVKRGGHFVDEESIRINFERGIDNFFNILPQFDNIMLVSGLNEHPELVTNPKLLLTIRNGLITQQAKDIPTWSQKTIERLIGDLGLQRKPSNLER